ncbi:plasmid partitioning protein RepB C-terminal domain-containing protein [Variovorax humicola]|uniref:Plasmid partitioning protein RepB C-terminal domain-containing protein n=1 Tax=Variovorax humicola TaxID=1769758 RepID=A0ABU8W9H7_9BURK
MSNLPTDRELRMVPIDRIDVLNPRERDPEVFAKIVENIRAIGLKKPITVTPRAGTDGAERYLLVCGEGRLTAFRVLGETRIPALVVDATDEDAYLMSLSENIARRKYRALELLSGIGLLKEKGHSAGEIAEKIGVGVGYVRDILILLDKGEERLLTAVHRGQMGLNTAISIARAGDDENAIQNALQEAYDAGTLRGRQLIEVRRLLQRRRQLGRSTSRAMPRKISNVPSSSLVRTYQTEIMRQQVMVRRASLAQEQLLFILGALHRLIADENFTNLLRAEGLDAVPKYLSDRIVTAAPIA